MLESAWVSPCLSVLLVLPPQGSMRHFLPSHANNTPFTPAAATATVGLRDGRQLLSSATFPAASSTPATPSASATAR